MYRLDLDINELGLFILEVDYSIVTCQKLIDECTQQNYEAGRVYYENKMKRLHALKLKLINSEAV